jgi:hypothetical protein
MSLDETLENLGVSRQQWNDALRQNFEALQQAVDEGSAEHPLRTIKDYPDVPDGAKALGCRNCRTGDRMRHPELGLVYCASCPVTLRREARGIE